MKYEDFEKFVREKCMYDTIYDDSDGRQILIIQMLDAYGMVDKALRARLAQPEPEPEKSQDKPCVEDDGCPTEKAVLQRFWREHQAQPEPAECDGGQCGIGGYCKECPKTQPEPDYEAEFIKDWNEGKVRRVSDGKRMVPEREWVGLTREELAEIAEFHFHGALSAREFYDDIEAKLKEKNT